ncbi:signal recognition particle-docking protein FtsY [Spiroplasma endosymbiont of Anurida maritima]
MEDILIQSDMGMNIVLKISNNIEKKFSKGWPTEKINDFLVEQLMSFYDDPKSKENKINLYKKKLSPILVVGVNGVGKTTSIAKIANFYKEKNYKVLLVAGDTFRAGAVEQLSLWAERLEIEIIKPDKEQQDPASVVYKGLEYGKNNNFDIVLIDTAGRLQNKVNLMKELEKINNIIVKVTNDKPAETLLVIDAITGQNGVIQAETFSEISKISGIVLTKMDGTAKGGVVLAIRDKLNIPVKFIGTGEKLSDISIFDIEEYVYNLTKDLFEPDIQGENDGN